MSIFSTLKNVVTKPVTQAVSTLKSIAGKPVTQAITAQALLNPVTSIPTTATLLTKSTPTAIKTIQGTAAVGAIAGGIAAGVATKSPSVGAAVSTYGGGISSISYLETAPKTSSIVKKVESVTGVATEKLGNVIAKNPLETALIAATAPLLIVGAAKVGSSVIKGATAGQVQQDVLKSSLSNITPSAGGYLGNKDIEEAMKTTKESELLPTQEKPLPSASLLSTTAPKDNIKVPEGYDVPIMAKDEKKRRRKKVKPVQPVRVYNRVGVDVHNRNVFKLVTH